MRELEYKSLSELKTKIGNKLKHRNIYGVVGGVSSFVGVLSYIEYAKETIIQYSYYTSSFPEEIKIMFGVAHSNYAAGFWIDAILAFGVSMVCGIQALRLHTDADHLKLDYHTHLIKNDLPENG